jgi:hypothetical protein
MSNTNKDIAVFLDNIGRTIIGKIANETPDTLTIQNPALVHIQANPQTQQLQLQILPLFFREFQNHGVLSTSWNFKKNNITTSEPIDFAPQFIAQYEQLFGAPQQKEPNVVKLFDDE